MTEGDLNIVMTPDEMQASVALREPQNGEIYKISDFESILRMRGISYGVDHDLVSKLIQDRIYNTPVVIAHGTQKIDGTDGYYEYKFQTEFSQKPEMHEDGTVDYWKLHVVELVNEGQDIVEAHDPVSHVDGMTITGKTLLAKKGKPVKPLMGRGFTASEDKKHFYAASNGKVELVNERVYVTDVYEVSGDVDMKTGNIDFHGDVVIHGNVTAGMEVKATGSITVDGTVEASSIIAGKDVIIRGGFIGGYRGVIETKKNLMVKFMQFGTATVYGSIQTDSIINCHVTCYDFIYMEGKHANILGGYVYAACGIDVYNIGSDKELTTNIVAGIERMHLQEIHELRTKIQYNSDLLKKLENTLVQLVKIDQKNGPTDKTKEQRTTLLRTKIQIQSDTKVKAIKLEELEQLRLKSENASVKAIRNIYPGVCITIGVENIQFTEKTSTLEVKINKANNKICMISLKG